MRWCWAAMGLAACYSPRIAPGVPCGPGGACPSTLVCAPATGTCEQSADGPPDAATGPGDASGDAPAGPGGDAPLPGDAGQVCFGSTVTVCVATPPTNTIEVTGNTAIDTDTSSMCSAGVTSSTSACFVVAQTIHVDAGATLVATGTRPLVLAAAGGLTVDGTVDVASRRSAAQIGAGADAADCAAGTKATNGGGGAGGSFGGLGGHGGQCMAGPASAGGLPAPVATPSGLHGGCPGGAGSATAGGTVGELGHGGGAVALVAGTHVTITGIVDASGEGGGGASAMTGPAGGGGGGAGGMIVLDAPQVSVASGAQVFANGGGGGATNLLAGNAGQDPASATTAAAGGSSMYGSGGDGAAGPVTAGSDGTSSTPGGGGGGGGAGVIHVASPSATLDGAVSPPAS